MKVVISIQRDSFTASYSSKSRYFKIVLTFLFPFLLFITLGMAMAEGKLTAVDDRFYHMVSRLISGPMTSVMRFFTFVGTWPVFVGITLAGILLFRRNRRYAFSSRMLGVNLILCWLLNEALKYGFHRVRPNILRLTEATGYSFPSGHSMTSMGFYGFIACVIYFGSKSRLRYLYMAGLGLLVVMIGFSRIYLGVHYTSDVLAGFAAGFAWLAGFCSLIGNQRLFPEESVKAQEHSMK